MCPEPMIPIFMATPASAGPDGQFRSYGQQLPDRSAPIADEAYSTSPFPLRWCDPPEPGPASTVRGEARRPGRFPERRAAVLPPRWPHVAPSWSSRRRACTGSAHTSVCGREAGTGFQQHVARAGQCAAGRALSGTGCAALESSGGRRKVCWNAVEADP